MYSSWQHRLSLLIERGGDTILTGGLKGLEKESLRVLANGQLAQTPHPDALGSALTHPNLTTDYSEALLEFITPPMSDIPQILRLLHDLHVFVYRNIGDELLWATSMPCIVGGDASIPIAQYGSSNVGLMKYIYRVGLDQRYGRLMQAISGVHFNYSLPAAIWPVLQAIDNDNRPVTDYQSDGYFHLIRNFQRHAWLVPYLFGASPAVCRTFLEGQPHHLENFDRHTLYMPYATSLRMSDIGYQNKAQDGLNVSYNNLDSYVADLGHAIQTPAPDYTALSVRKNGEWLQLNDSVLQIENEYYSFIRPKNIARSGEKPSLALRDRGVEYVEIRAPDVNIYDPLGVDETQLRFLEALLIFCLLEDSPLVSASEQADIDHNQALVTRRGREPGLHLRRQGKEIALQDWGLAVLKAVAKIARMLDNGSGKTAYHDAVEQQRLAMMDASRTPSARMLAEMREHGETFIAFAMRLSMKYAAEFRSAELADETLEKFQRLAKESLAEQAQIEANDAIPFEQYLEQYFAQT